MEKIKVVKYNRNQRNNINNSEQYNANAISFIIKLLINTFVLLLASSIFNGFYINGFMFAFLGALIINILNYLIKPILVIFTLPITIMSMGILYPIVNVIVLKLTALLLGSNFNVEGILVPFFISIFISFMNIILENIIFKGKKS